jgi:hypothetical protein
MTKSFAQHMDETTIGKVLDYLAATDEKSAELKMEVQRSKYLAELAESFAFKAITVGSVADKTAEVQLDKTVQAKWDAHFKALVDFEKVKARREHGVLLCDMWRTHAVNKRSGSV